MPFGRSAVPDAGSAFRKSAGVIRHVLSHLRMIGDVIDSTAELNLDTMIMQAFFYRIDAAAIDSQGFALRAFIHVHFPRNWSEDIVIPARSIMPNTSILVIEIVGIARPSEPPIFDVPINVIVTVARDWPAFRVGKEIPAFALDIETISRFRALAWASAGSGNGIGAADIHATFLSTIAS